MIQFQRFSTICHNRALIEGGIAGTLMILGLLSGFSVYVDKGVIWDLSMLWACCLVWWGVWLGLGIVVVGVVVIFH